MEQIINIVQIVLAVILIVIILLQNKGSSLGGAFGGSGGEGNVYRTKRGFEKTLFISSIIISILFFGVALANILLK